MQKTQTEKKTHLMTIKIEPKTLCKLKEVAHKEQRTVSNLVRLWISESLTRIKKAS